MASRAGIQWTNKSVLQLAGSEDPVDVIERRAKEIVLKALDSGWSGPPFNPLAIADMMGIAVEPNASVADARTIASGDKLKIQFNPTQSRGRVRFSIAHEIAHAMFRDVADEVRYRGGNPDQHDDWQLEMLCNLAAAEFVMPTGSLEAQQVTPTIERLMLERCEFDVSTEAFLIRVAKVARQPILMFCASPIAGQAADTIRYRLEYTVASYSWGEQPKGGRLLPEDTVLGQCTAIGHTARGEEAWFDSAKAQVECVGIPAYPGNFLPRVAGIIRRSDVAASAELIEFLHGDVLSPKVTGPKIICQLVNDQARTWGGGVARAAAKKFPQAQESFSDWITAIPRRERLGRVQFADVSRDITIASLVAQAGFGASEAPRIRYFALEKCLTAVAERAAANGATVHMPRLGSGAAGGAWQTVEELIRAQIVSKSIRVRVYDLPPKQGEFSL